MQREEGPHQLDAAVMQFAAKIFHFSRRHFCGLLCIWFALNTSLAGSKGYDGSEELEVYVSIRQVAGGAVTLNINGVGTCLVIPSLRCFCCQFLPAFSSHQKERGNFTFTSTVVTTTVCTVSVPNLCRRLHLEENRPEILPSVVDKYYTPLLETLHKLSNLSVKVGNYTDSRLDANNIRR